MRKMFLFCILSMLTTATAGFAVGDYRTRIAVLPMRNATGEKRYDSVCTTVTDTVALVFRLMGKYAVAEADENPALRAVDSTSNEALAAFADASGYDELLLGSTTKDAKGVLTFALSLYDCAKKAVVVDASATARSILEVFDAADQITVGLLSQVSDVHIGFGAVEVTGESGKGVCAVYLNDARIKSPKSMLRKVLNGGYTLSIRQERLLGDTEIYKARIEVFEGETTKVSFTIPPATTEEKAFFDAKRAALLAIPDGQVDSLLAGIADFQRSTRAIDYDDALKAQRAQVLDAAAARALAMLKAATADSDAAFYAKDPDFKAVLESYRTLDRLVSSSFDCTVVDAGTEEPFAAPSMVQVAPDGTLLTLDVPSPVRIAAAADGKKVSAVKLMENLSASLSSGQIAFDSSSQAYYIHPDSPEILVLDRNLGTIRSIPIPDFHADVHELFSIAVSDAGAIYLLGSSRVLVLDPDGQRESTIEASLQQGLKANTADNAECAFFDRDGQLDVLDATTGRILAFDELGVFQTVIPLPDVVTTDSRAAVDALGYFYVTIPGEHRIVKLSPQGELIASFGGYGVSPGQFSFPQGIAVSSAGTIYVADTYNNRVQALAPTTTPVLYADVARYGITLEKRVQRAAQAQERIDAVMAGINPQEVARPLEQGAALLAISAGFAMVSAGAEGDFLTTTTSIGAQACLAGGAGLLTTALITGLRNATARADAISQIQAFDMDSQYELDKERYRNLALAESVGFWNGLVFPLLGSAELLLLESQSESMSYFPQIVAGMMAAFPPIFSNLYAGRLDTGLLISGLTADAFVALSAALYIKGVPDWIPTEIPRSIAKAMPTLAPTLGIAWAAARAELPLSCLVTALGIRLAAGAYDYRTGWIEAKDYNLYKAIKKKTPAPEVSLELPPQGGVEVAIAFPY